MKIFIDSRDLINIFNSSDPISIDDLAQGFRRYGHQLVLPWSVVSELVPRDRNPIVMDRRFVKIEDDVPHVFFRQMVSEPELRAAYSHFSDDDNAGVEWTPFVTTFHEAYSQAPRSDLFSRIVRLEIERTVGGRRLSFQIRRLAEANPNLFDWGEGAKARAVAAILEDRARGRISARNRYRDLIQKWALGGIVDLEITADRANAFADWLRVRPREAPGWRLFNETFEQMVRDTTYTPSVNDVYDLAHVMLIPYVDAATLDGNKVEMVNRAVRVLRDRDVSIDYDSRVTSSLRALLERPGILT